MIFVASPVSPQLTVWLGVDKGRLVGGSDAVRNQFPHQVSFQWVESGVFNHACGGSILSPTYVLTAGHCVLQSPEPNFRVVAGIINLKESGVVVDVAETLVHPSYEG